MKFTYNFENYKQCFVDEDGEDYYSTEDYDFEVDIDDIRKTLAKLIYDDYFKNSKNEEIINMIYKMIYDLDLDDDLIETYYDSLKDYYEDEAKEEFEDTL